MEKIRLPVMAYRAVAAGLFAIILLAPSCRTTPVDELQGGVLAEFDVNGERFAIFVTNPETIAAIFALRDGLSNAGIPSGRVRRGPVAYNRPWSWHIDSEDIAMAEATIELCDATPSYLEAHLDWWLEKVVRFCPWSARLVAVTDYR